ncbi:hypothetical protein PVK06_043536 [Gossypium arboreum]|uniref:Uncharacterized protein n=1 Tax=Gossypium arboreum TaxID=29729 RepID=A0ABR0MP77_GOSAR|nr:hypothetical protein PVK06_043536 [Gossypium arboreum]
MVIGSWKTNTDIKRGSVQCTDIRGAIRVSIAIFGRQEYSHKHPYDSYGYATRWVATIMGGQATMSSMSNALEKLLEAIQCQVEMSNLVEEVKHDILKLDKEVYRTIIEMTRRIWLFKKSSDLETMMRS